MYKHLYNKTYYGYVSKYYIKGYKITKLKHLLLCKFMRKSKYQLLVFLTAYVVTNSNAQIVIADKTIANGKLKWEDFSGPVDPTSKYWATTHWLVNYKYKVLSFRGDTVKVDLQVSTFLKGISWVLPDKKTDELLQHEQGHFDIGRLCALKFKKVIMSTILLKSTYAKQIDLIFKSLIIDANLMDLQYDKETNHALNRSEQKKWNEKINTMLINP